MFERFTDRARRVIVVAQDAAREMGHAQIKPEHLVVGLQKSEGLTANVMAQAGIDGAALRQRVATMYPSDPGATKVDKVPFSVEAKRSLEQSLRAALGLGHSYIGTEHLFFGIERQSESGDRSLDDVLGTSAAHLHERLMELLGTAKSGPAMYSPALFAALEQARTGRSATTTGDVLGAMLADPDSQVARAIAALGVDTQRLRAALHAVLIADTSDAGPLPKSITIAVGETNVVTTDPDLVRALDQLSAEELLDLIKKGVAG